MDRNFIASELLTAAKEMTAKIDPFKELHNVGNHLEEAGELIAKLMSKSNREDVGEKLGQNGKVRSDLQDAWNDLVGVQRKIREVKKSVRK